MTRTISWGLDTGVLVAILNCGLFVVTRLFKISLSAILYGFLLIL